MLAIFHGLIQNESNAKVSQHIWPINNDTKLKSQGPVHAIIKIKDLTIPSASDDSVTCFPD